MRKIFSLLIIVFLLMSMFYPISVFADDSGIEGIKSAMSTIGSAPDSYETSSTATVINNVIGIMQLVGTGISLIVISILGIKYLLASPSDKADVKKNIMPILIGCILLFAAVQIVGIIENFSNEAFGSGTSEGADV